jgi:acetyl-CoA carboxylase biotin carboxyl carrier protein
MPDAGPQPDIEKIRQLVALMERRGLCRLVLTENGVTLRLETGPAPAALPVAVPAEMLATMVPGVVSMAGVPAAAPEELIAAPQAEEAPEEEGIALLSPTTGTFYRAPAPGEPPFVDVGDIVEVGQTIGIIMAMKVMSEVPAETAGEVVAIPAQDAELVQSGTPLIVIKPS